MGIRFAVDIGVASVGWAVVNDEYVVLESGVNIFPCADASKNAERRNFRQLKRLHRRRKNRVSDFEKLWQEENLEIPKNNQINVLQLRVKGLSEKLTQEELFWVLKNELLHRGISYLDDALEEGAANESDYKKALERNQTELTQNEYSTEFILHLKTLIYIYKSNSLLQAGNFEQALELRDKQENELLKKVTSLGLESQLRLYLSFAVLGMYTKDYVQARKYMKKIFSLGKLFCAFPSYKIARLVNLLLQAELGNYDFFENEIISIKRNIRFEKQTYITEKLIFKFIQGYPLPSYEKARNKRWLQYQKDIQKIEQDKYERQLLKTFDVLTWIESKLTQRSLADIFIEKAH